MDELQYACWNISGVDLDAGLKSSVASVHLTSDNALLKMQTEADMRLDRKYMDGKLNVNVEELDLYKLGVAPSPLEHPFRLVWVRRHATTPLSCKWMPAI